MDEIDVKILRLLWEDGRMPIYHIAERIGLSNAAINKRLEAMKRRGELRGFTVLLNSDLILNSAVVEIRARKKRCQVWQAIEKISGIMHFVACLGGRYYGEFWYRDRTELKDKLTMFREFTSAYRLETYVHRKLSEERIDEIDWKIIKALKNDARMPFSKLSQKLNISTKTIAKRWKKLSESEICKAYPIINRPISKDLFWFSVFIEVDDFSIENKLRRIENLWRTSVFVQPPVIYGVFYATTVKQIDDTLEILWNFKDVRKLYYEIIVEEKFYPEYVDYIYEKYRS